MSLFLIESAGFEQFTRLGEIRGEPGGSGVSAEGAELEVGQQTEHRESRRVQIRSSPKAHSVRSEALAACWTGEALAERERPHLRNQINLELAWHVTHAGLVARLASLMAAAVRLALKVFSSAGARSSVGVFIVDTNSPMPHAKYYISHNLRLQRTIPCVGGASRQMIG